MNYNYYKDSGILNKIARRREVNGQFCGLLLPDSMKNNDNNIENMSTLSLLLFIRSRRKTPCFSYGDIRHSKTKFLLKW